MAGPVIMKDCLIRKPPFPIQKCRSLPVSSLSAEMYRIKAYLVIKFQNMENLIRRSFSHLESLNSEIVRGSYDIRGPTGEIILQEIWDTVIKPAWTGELRLWEYAETRRASQKDLDFDVVEITPYWT